MKYENKRNGKVAEIVKQDKEKGTILLQFTDGSSTMVTEGTFKRWYKAVEQEVVETAEPEPVATVEPEVVVEETTEPEVVTEVQEEPVVKKEKKVTGRTMPTKDEVFNTLVSKFSNNIFKTKDTEQREIYIVVNKRRQGVIIVAKNCLKLVHDCDNTEFKTELNSYKNLKQFNYITQVSDVDTLINYIKLILKEE